MSKIMEAWMEAVHEMNEWQTAAGTQSFREKFMQMGFTEDEALDVLDALHENANNAATFYMMQELAAPEGESNPIHAAMIGTTGATIQAFTLGVRFAAIRATQEMDEK